VVKERRVWMILSYLPPRFETPAFIDWMMAGIAERKRCEAIRRWRELPVRRNKRN
jgi:hypothetical protein